MFKKLIQWGAFLGIAGLIFLMIATSDSRRNKNRLITPIELPSTPVPKKVSVMVAGGETNNQPQKRQAEARAEIARLQAETFRKLGFSPDQFSKISVTTGTNNASNGVGGASSGGK